MNDLSVTRVSDDYILYFGGITVSVQKYSISSKYREILEDSSSTNEEILEALNHIVTSAEAKLDTLYALRGNFKTIINK